MGASTNRRTISNVIYLAAVATGFFLLHNSASTSASASETRILQADRLWQISVEQHSGDLVIEVAASGSNHRFDHPTGHAEKEVFFLGPYTSETKVEIKLRPKLRSDIAVGKIEVIERDVSISGCATAINHAATRFADTGDYAQASVDYQLAFESCELSDLQDFASRQRGFAALEARAPADAEAAMLQLSEDCDAEACYRNHLLRANTLFQLDRYPEAAEVYAEVARELSAVQRSEGLQREYAEVLALYGFALVLSNRKDEGALILSQAEQLSRELEHDGIMGDTLALTAGLHAYNGDFVLAEQTLHRGESTS